MDFFAQQARVRVSSRRLVVLFVLAVAAIVLAIDLAVWFAFGQRALPGEPAPSNQKLMLATSLIVVVGIALSSLYRVMALAGGGKDVAATVGAVAVPAQTTDPQLKRLRNVVEEVAIAAGVPVPDLYLMPEEAGINAFAAGYSPADAVVCVTQGCLDALSRDELQGVVAHEFSHVLNGDMRLNIRLMGLLFGIFVLAIIGQRMLWFGGGGSSERREGRGSGQVWVLALALMAAGYVGYFFGRLIQAAVSRSRESLADLSAVQFTRQTSGIAGALKKIAVTDLGSSLRAPHRQEVAHMLFGEVGRFNALFATHPPLLERIRVLEPGFRAEDLEKFAAAAARGDASPGDAAPADTSSSAGTAASGVRAGMASTLLAGAAAAALGTSLDRAATLRQDLPGPLAARVREPGGARLAMLALAVSVDPGVRARQQRLLANAFGDDVQHAVADLLPEVAALAPGLRLPLAVVAFPALRRLPAGEVRTLLDALDALARADGAVDLEEYCLSRLLRVQLAEVLQPRSAPVDGTRKLTACRDSVAFACALVAAKGAADPAAARRAWLLAMQHAYPGAAMEWPELPDAWQAPLDRALADLDGLVPAAKELVVQALAMVVHADGEVTVAEADLLRVICAGMHCPLAL